MNQDNRERDRRANNGLKQMESPEHGPRIRERLEAMKGVAPAQKPDALEAFRAWFGASKAVDAEGKPLVVYHGTRRQFNEFSPSKPRGAPGNPEGVYFTADKGAAEEYAQDVDGAWDEKSRVVAAYIKIENDADGKIIDSAYRGREYVVFKAENIKSATDNPDIRFSRTPAAQTETLAVSEMASQSQRGG